MLLRRAELSPAPVLVARAQGGITLASVDVDEELSLDVGPSCGINPRHT